MESSRKSWKWRLTDTANVPKYWDVSDFTQQLLLNPITG